MKGASMKPVIAIICNTALHVHRSRTTLIRALQACGAQILLISPRDASVPELERMGVIHEHVGISQYGTNPVQEAAAYFAIRAALRRHRPAVCLCYTIKANTIGALAAQALSIPVINNIAGTGRAFDGAGRLKRAFFIALYAKALRRSARVFFQNTDDLQFFLQHGMVGEAAARHIPGSGVNLQRFTPSAEFPEEVVFLYVGRLLISKGAQMFIDAAREMLRRGTSARFVIAGERLDESGYVSAGELAAFARAEQCSYLGQVPPGEIAALLRSCSVLVLPSYYGEGVPRTLLEAGAVGRPIISTDSVGCKDVIRHGVNGLKIAPRDQEELLAAMQEVAEMEAGTLHRLGAQNRNIVETRFDEKIVIQAYLDECGRFLSGLAAARA
ncbi:glycosyltransferase family 4 protein [Cribrihabitans neustonicus]|uniref:glycosyltransferase family 4 protein n=1 Tax=Cribrihabitans neustonicus TaxID=1429085 RepID=UPI003B5A9DEF